MNIDTDLQFAYTEGIRDYMVKILRLKLVTLKEKKNQTRNSTTKSWVRKGEETFSKIGSSFRRFK
jgi:fructose-bisphosphate aldolase class II